jgi:hypothetical protein
MNRHAWIIIDKNNKFVGIDMSSGGYPYPTDDLQSAKWYSTEEETERFLQSFGENTSYDKGYKVYELYARVE